MPPGRKVPHDVPDSEFEIPLDTLILAISQHSVLDFFGDEQPALTGRGYIDVDPFTFETSIPGIYAGGDVAGDGPSSIVKAASEGKAVAAAIIAAGEPTAPPDDEEPAPVDLHEMVIKRARRRVPRAHRARAARGHATGSSRRCWATPPSRPWPRRAAASTATRSAACAWGSAPTWR